MGPMLLAASVAAAPITTGSLVREMVDLRHLCTLAGPSYRTIQFSSYDRRSIAPYAPGWYANSDGFGREPIPGFIETLTPADANGVGRWLLCDVTGPGALVRVWTAAINGELTVWLDDAPEPLYQGPAQRFLQDLYSHFAMQLGLADKELESGFRQNMAGYFPIPFARRCRIEWAGNLNQLHFYAVEARIYEPGTSVTTFAPEDLRTYAAEIAAALPVLQDGRAWQPPEPGREVPLEAYATPDRRVELAKLEGGGCIQWLRLRVQADDLFRALRQVILKGYFDGSPQPQIEAPIGDFFGAGPGLAPYSSVPFTVEPDGTMTCRFPMPFRDTARFELHHLGAQPATVRGALSVRPEPWTAESLHLHARWRIDHDLTAAGGDDAVDLPFLTARGRGKLAGIAVMLLNPSGVPTSGGNWWGEGDEKIWVDDEAFPSLFGTGSEDYFNYAWSRPELWAAGYCGQPLNTGPANRGFVANYRWHILDPIPFAKSLTFAMELFCHTPTPGFSYGRGAWFYAAPDLRDDRVPLTRMAVMHGLELPANYEPVAAGQANGATFLQAEELLIGTPRGTRIAEDRAFARNKALWWTPQVDGEVIELAFDLERAGRYQLVPVFVRTPRSGRVEVTLDDHPLTPVADLYEPFHTRVDNHWLRAPEGDMIELPAGRHVIRLTSRGRNEASGGSEVGVDFFWLRPGR